MKIIAVSGKTATSKDTIARHIKEKYDIPPIVSYSTRPIRENETDGLEHYFINDERMDEIVKDEASMLAFVQFPKTGFRYCATTADLEEDAIRTYIIDPSGLAWLKSHRPDVEIFSIFLDLDEETIRERALGRGDKLEDIEERLESEREMFKDFAESKAYDVRIETNKELKDVLAVVDEIINNILAD